MIVVEYQNISVTFRSLHEGRPLRGDEVCEMNPYGKDAAVWSAFPCFGRPTLPASLRAERAALDRLDAAAPRATLSGRLLGQDDRARGEDRYGGW
jgi:hypothetical protein